MISNRERDCIKKTRQTTMTAAKTRLIDIKSNGIPFDSPVNGITDGFIWNESLGGKIKQIALLPIYLLFVLVSFAMTPIAYIKHLRKANHEKKELEKAILVLETESLSGQAPDVKNLESLWALHGLDERECSHDQQISVLCGWIDVLYGENASECLNINTKVGDITGRNLQANLRCYEDVDAPHFRFASPVDSLVRQVSEELPLYEK